MKKVNDSKIYKIASLVVLSIAVIIGAISYYSLYSIEPKITQLLSVEENHDEAYKKAYLMLREPQLFAGYDRFDGQDRRIKDWLQLYDKRINENIPFSPKDGQYLEVFLDRRNQGSSLGRLSMFFLLVVAFVLFSVSLFESRKESG